MAFENVNFKYPIFCVGPQAGTFCSVNQDSATTILEIKNAAGGTVANYTFSSSILSEVKGLEYVGPTNLLGLVDGLTFFVLEKVSDSLCMIKRFEVKTSSFQLALKSKIIKSSSGANYYDAAGMAVEHYTREFGDHNAGGINYLDIDDTSELTSGMKLFLGPSDDSDNVGATEFVIVNSIVGNRVYLDTNIIYQYVSGDPITYYKSIFLISNKNVGGGDNKGTIFQLNAETGANISAANDGLYKDVEAVKWYEPSKTIAAVKSMSLIFIQPFVSYQIWRSQNMNNIENDKAELIAVYDIAFGDTIIYKLMDRVTKRDDSGTLSTFYWNNYNYQQDTISPYVNALNLYTLGNTLIGPSESVDIEVKLVDQFGVGLGFSDIVFTHTGDPAGTFDPITGVVTTNSQGRATITYNSGATYTGSITIEANTTGGLPTNGSQYVWGFTHLISFIEVSFNGYVYQIDDTVETNMVNLKQKDDEFNIETRLFSKTFFSTNGGDWVNPSIYYSEATVYLPTLNIGFADGPTKTFESYTPPGGGGGGNYGTVRQLLDFETNYYLPQRSDYETVNLLFQREVVEGSMRFSQLKLSLHTYWVGITAYDELSTTTNLNQFVFVQEAIPIFWSEKNSRDTYVWIKLRPYAADLDPTSVLFMMREVWYNGDTGYVDYTSSLSITTFEDIGGNLGLELYLDPAEEFHHNAVVYIHIEVKDVLGNNIWVDYFFSIIADYRFPYLENLSPGREDALVPIDTSIYFEIKDEGAGVDIDSLELHVNTRYALPTTIEKVSDHHYKITYTPPEPFYNNKAVHVAVKIKDLADSGNWVNDTYRFYTAESDAVWFTGFEPEVCKRGINPDSIISFLALGQGSGVDKDTIAVQVQGKDVTNELKLIPVIYRIS